MAPQRIGIDLDGVLAAMDLVWYDRYNKVHKQELTHATIRDWDFEGANLVIPESDFYALRTPDMYLEVQALPGSIEAVKTLETMGYDPIIITADSAKFTDAKIDWLARHGLGHLTTLVRRDKAAASLENGVELLIDDSPLNAIEVANAGIDVFLFDNGGQYLYNQHSKYVYPRNVYRVSDWQTIIRRLSF